ncbi:hypothetical protein [Nocardioides sp.]|uniref:hypothetical protein n=1 Tax=Nocardioides sp. TaxID=35761 RepID=UPI003D1327C8
MATAHTFAMALRTGNWGRGGIILPFHKPVVVELAPPDLPEVVVRFVVGLTAVPRCLSAADLTMLQVADPGGRPVLHVDRRTGHALRAGLDHTHDAANWELQLEGKDSLLVFYSRTEDFPSDGLLDDIAARLLG